MGKLNEFNRDEINMVLQKLLQNLELDPLPPIPAPLQCTVLPKQGKRILKWLITTTRNIPGESTSETL